MSNVSPHIRARAFALGIFFQHAFGDATSPLLVGALSDAWGLKAAVCVLPATLAVAAVFWGRAYLTVAQPVSSDIDRDHWHEQEGDESPSFARVRVRALGTAICAATNSLIACVTSSGANSAQFSTELTPVQQVGDED